MIQELEIIYGNEIKFTEEIIEKLKKYFEDYKLDFKKFPNAESSRYTLFINNKFEKFGSIIIDEGNNRIKLSDINKYKKLFLEKGKIVINTIYNTSFLKKKIESNNKDQEFYNWLGKINDNSTDVHKILTPLSLCREMLNSLFKNGEVDQNKSYLCLVNLEFVYCLKQMKGNLDNVYFATNDIELKGKVVEKIGINKENIIYLNYDTVKIDTEMKFDYIISNPPYNPNSLWKKFVELQISLLKEDGKMVTIHPSLWRETSKNKKIFDILKQGIEELHICDYENFKENKVGIKTDWYSYSKNYKGEQKVFYSNGEQEILDLRDKKLILRISNNSIPYSIFNKVLTKKDNGLIIDNGFNKLYKKINHKINGKYKQCGGEGNGTGWCDGNFVLTDEPSKHQFENKVVMSYSNKPRAKYFNKEEEIGVVLANYWLTDNQNLPILLNSKMFWKIVEEIIGKPNWFKTFQPMRVPAWILNILNFDDLTATTEEELYQHYKLTQEEIYWVENDK